MPDANRDLAPPGRLLRAEVERRFGVLPNFFRLPPDNPEITAALWGFATFAYLDSPLPSLFKERLFVFLSRFCKVRYCIARHLGFLVGMGRPSGDATSPVQSIAEVIPLIRRPLPRRADLVPLLAQLSKGGVLAELPGPDTPAEEAVFACAAHVFLETPDAAGCLDALRRGLGGVRFQYLLVFLAFVRTAHFWSRVQTGLRVEDDVEHLLATNAHLAEAVAYDPEARAYEASRALADEFAAPRGGAARDGKRRRDGERALDLSRADLVDGVPELRAARRAALNVMEDAVQARDALRASEERLRLALSAARMGIWTWEVATDLLRRDTNLNALLGLPAEETVRPFAEFLTHIHPADRDAVRSAFDQSVRQSRPLNTEFRVVRPDGAVRWLRDQGGVFGTAGQARMSGACVDVTDLKETEAALRVSERELAAQLSASQRFHALSARLLADGDTAGVFAEVLELAAGFLDADCASLHALDSDGRVLRLLAHRGFHPDSAAYWETVHADSASAYGRCLASGERVVVDDVEGSGLFEGGDSGACRRSDIRGVQTTPLVSRTGRLLGAISTHWRRPHRPSERQLASFDAVSRQTADLIERTRVDESLRQAKDELEARVVERTTELAAANESLRAEMAARADLARRLSSAQEDERRRLSRDLHDTIGQLMAGLSLAFKAVETSGGLTPSAAAKLAEAQRVADALGKEVHGLAVRLRPISLDDLGLEAALGQLVGEWSGRTGVRAEFQAVGEELGRLPSEVETAVYRIVQEALTNTAKHARATRVGVVVTRPGSHVAAVVEDNGIGFDPDAVSNGRLGLLGMRERAALVGGEVELESRPGGGTTLVVRIPISEGGGP